MPFNWDALCDDVKCQIMQSLSGPMSSNFLSTGKSIYNNCDLRAKFYKRRQVFTLQLMRKERIPHPWSYNKPPYDTPCLEIGMAPGCIEVIEATDDEPFPLYDLLMKDETNMFTVDDDLYPFWFYALHSKHTCFKPGFSHYGDIEYDFKQFACVPPRGRWPVGYIWNYQLGGFIKM